MYVMFYRRRAFIELVKKVLNIRKIVAYILIIMRVHMCIWTRCNVRVGRGSVTFVSTATFCSRAASFRKSD